MKRKRKPDQILGQNPWDIDIDFLINHRGIDPDKARTVTVLRWMYWGDLRPLAATIWQAGDNSAATITLEKALLNHLATMIDDGRLTAQARWPSRPMKLDKSAQYIVAALLYEDFSTSSCSDDAFQKVAGIMGMSEKTVRRAVTSLRKSNAAASAQ
jgi:hypothetical protein